VPPAPDELLAVLVPVDPQPITNNIIASAGTAKLQRERDFLTLMANAKNAAASNANRRSRVGGSFRRKGSAVPCAVELTVTCAVAPLAPGVTVPGDMLHVDPVGAPEQVNVTA